MANDAATDELLNRVLAVSAGKYRDICRAVYLHGSRRDGAEQPGSDIDLTIVIEDSPFQAHLEGDLRNLALDFPVPLDARVFTRGQLVNASHAFYLGRVALAGKLVYGAALAGLDDFSRKEYLHHVDTQALKGISLLRGADVDSLSEFIDYPDSSLPFFGYEIVRKPSWYTAGETRGTRELVATATWCASALLARSDPSVALSFSKLEAVERYRSWRPGPLGAVIFDLWTLCRVRYDGAIPTDTADWNRLHSLCEQFLGFERETLTAIRSEAVGRPK